MKKNLITIGIIFSAIFIVGLVFHFRLESMEGPSIAKPPIVDHFACSDYCPGPQEKYMVKIYQGVEDEGECRKLGGKPSSYTGWGTTKICIVE